MFRALLIADETPSVVDPARSSTSRRGLRRAESRYCISAWKRPSRRWWSRFTRPWLCGLQRSAPRLHYRPRP